MATKELQLMAHLLRRAGFGATRNELESYVAQGYEETVEELLHPEEIPDFGEDIYRRYYPARYAVWAKEEARTDWLYRMVNTKCPLKEKMALFWHGLFATSAGKSMQAVQVRNQIDMFHRYGLGSFHNILVELSKNPAMICWLDNNENHKDAPNENYGRELLELFSMGVGNYTEADVKAAARAFTGWTIANPIHGTLPWPYGFFDWKFEYHPEDHDDSEKVFLGHQGRFNGEDVIDIIARNPATAQFVSKELYNFFVADLPGNPSWQPTGDVKAAINILADAYMTSKYDIRAILRTLYNSDFFKSEKSWYAKVKSPAELVVGTLRLVGGVKLTDLALYDICELVGYMGQELLNPPSVEGWHEGVEWIDSGALIERVNFAAAQVGDVSKPGVKAIIDRIKARGPTVSPEQLVDACLDLVGPLTVAEDTRRELLQVAERGGQVRFSSAEASGAPAKRVAEILQLLVATREYQFA